MGSPRGGHHWAQINPETEPDLARWYRQGWAERVEDFHAGGQVRDWRLQSAPEDEAQGWAFHVGYCDSMDQEIWAGEPPNRRPVQRRDLP